MVRGSRDGFNKYPHDHISVGQFSYLTIHMTKQYGTLHECSVSSCQAQYVEVTLRSYLNTGQGGILICQHYQVVSLHIKYAQYSILPPVVTKDATEVLPSG